MQKPSNYHTHTQRCKHAKGPDRAYACAAADAGFSVLGYTDHMPWPWTTGYQSPVRMQCDELRDYAASIHQLRTEFSDRLSIHLGAECEYFPDWFHWLEDQKEQFGLEYLILAIHCAPYEDNVPSYAQTQDPTDLAAYTDYAIAGMQTGLFAFLCHPDLPLKSYPRFDSAARNMSEQICAAAKQLNIPLEYNLAGLRLRSHSPGWGYTSTEFWSIAAEHACTAVITYDAHEPEVISDTAAYTTAAAQLTAKGIRVLHRLPGLE